MIKKRNDQKAKVKATPLKTAIQQKTERARRPATLRS